MRPNKVETVAVRRLGNTYIYILFFKICEGFLVYE